MNHLTRLFRLPKARQPAEPAEPYTRRDLRAAEFEHWYWRHKGNDREDDKLMWDVE